MLKGAVTLTLAVKISVVLSKGGYTQNILYVQLHVI